MAKEASSFDEAESVFIEGLGCVQRQRPRQRARCRSKLETARTMNRTTDKADFLLNKMIISSRQGDVGRALVGVPEILKVRAIAQECDDATKYGQHCELFFLLMSHETFSFTQPHAQHPA